MGGFGKRATLALAALCLALTGSVQAQTAAPAPNTAPPVAAPAAAPNAPLDRVRFEAFMNGAIREALASRHIAGVTFSAIDRQGVIMARGYGEAAPGQPTDADSLFRVGSISKTFTWIALMQLAEQGKLTLDDPINDHLPPELQIPDEGFSEPIRIKHLMNHNAGFEDSALGHLFVRDVQRVLPMETYLQRYRVHRVRPPGQIASYSNYGATLAGALVAHESGMDWPSYAEQKILRPLGMTLSTFREPYSAEIAQANGLPAPMAADAQAHVNRGYDFEGGALVAKEYEFITQASAAGSLSANANDMARYMQALLDPEIMARAGVLSAENALKLRDVTFSNAPELGGWRHGFITYDLGAGRWAYGHTGGTARQFSIMLVSPDLGFGMFLSTNSGEGGALLASAVEAAMREFYPTNAAPPPRVANAAAESARVIGSYRLTRRAYHRTERAYMGVSSQLNVLPAPEGDIITLAGARGLARLRPIGNGVFLAQDGYTRVVFAERAGRMTMARDEMIGERIGFFDNINWLAIICGLGLIVALWGTIAGLRRIVGGRENRAALGFDVTAALWLAAFVTFGLVVLTLTSSQANAIFAYPGLAPVAGWLALIATIATPLALLLALFVWRPKDWSVLRWVRAGAAVAVFAALGATLGAWGFLGYSGF